RPEKFGAPAIMGERHKCIARVEITLHRSKIGFHGPEGGNHAGRHSEFALCPCKDLRILLELLPADVEPGLADRPPGEFEEGLPEDALRPVAGKNLLVHPSSGKRRIGSTGGNTLRNRLRFHGLEKALQVASAGCCRSLCKGCGGK